MPEFPVLDEEALELLLRLGNAGLVYRRAVATGGAVADLHGLRQQHRVELMRARLRERCLSETVSQLRERGVESIAIKGWAIARSYPDPGMRPYGDLDLCVADSDYEHAFEVLGEREHALAPAELHPEAKVEGDLEYRSLLAASRLIPLNGVEIRVPSEEDHLRLLSMHMLRHGAWRPLWLCDVAVAVETRSPGFDWELCFHGDPRLTRWVRTSLLLAREVLGADLAGVPLDAADRLPPWTVQEVYRAWSRGTGGSMGGACSVALQHAAPNPLAMARVLRSHWMNALEAAYRLRIPPGALAPALIRTAAALKSAPRVLRDLAQPHLKPVTVNSRRGETP